MSLSVKCFTVGVVIFLVYTGMLFLPWQNIHGGTFTMITLLIGLVPPPLCFATGLLIGLLRKAERRPIALILNSFGLVVYALWISGKIGGLIPFVTG